MSKQEVAGIKAQAWTAWRALSDALDRMADHGQQPVCASNPNQWAEEAKATAKLDAAEACGYCPALHYCASFADANSEKTGVWAGVDRGTKPRRVREAA